MSTFLKNTVLIFSESSLRGIGICKIRQCIVIIDFFYEFIPVSDFSKILQDIIFNCVKIIFNKIYK